MTQKTTLIIACIFSLPLTVWASPERSNAPSIDHRTNEACPTVSHAGKAVAKADGFYEVASSDEKPDEATAVIVGTPWITIQDIKEVELRRDERAALGVGFQTKFLAGLKLKKMTRYHVGQYMALVLDNQVVSVSQIQAVLNKDFAVTKFASNAQAKQVYSTIKCHIQAEDV